MRYVDIASLRVRGNWHEHAEAATRAVLEGRSAPDDNGEIWRDIKSQLAKLLHQKCWFCETPIPRSDNAVDHFRPKGRVSDALQQHSGYRWLAFELGNFRYACTYCNSRRVDIENATAGGKADRFPLLNEDARVYAVNPLEIDFSDLLATVCAEQPEILDPCNIDDWELLGCKRENGDACAASPDPTVISRVARSIEVYHLNHNPTCKQRHRAAIALLSEVRLGKQAFLEMVPDNSASVAAFQKIKMSIQRMIDRSAPYSGEMHFLLRGQRSPEHPWIRKLLRVG